LNVYYVTATHAGASTIPSAAGPISLRTDVAKFFSQADADAFAATLDPSWRDRRVELHEESAEAQHPTHTAR
jgi:O-succinylbenzoate synthase